MKKNIKAIYFDLDNTLIDRNAAFEACIADFFTKILSDFDYKKEKDKIIKKDNFGYTKRSMFCDWFVKKYNPKGFDSSLFWHYQKENISNYIAPVNTFIKNQLLQLKQRYSIGIITNGSVENQSKKLEKSGLLEIFNPESIYISAAYQAPKPSTILFELALEKLQLQAAEMLYIGDNPRHDILVPQQLGIQTCWLNQNRTKEIIFSSDYEYKNISDFLYSSLCS